jgi:hypothetical protein
MFPFDLPYLLRVTATDLVPLGTIIGPGAEALAGWTGETLPEGCILLPHGEKTPAGAMRELFGERFPDLRGLELCWD